jgi:hypothetical protein
MPLQTFHRGLRQLSVASWTSENSYGTQYDVLGAREMSVSWTIDSDELRGDDAVLDRFSKVVAVELTLSHASVDLSLLDLLMGGTLVSNASYEDFIVGSTDEVPYVAIAGRVVGSGGSSDLHIFIPKAKLSGNLNYAAQLDTYLIPSATFQGVREGDTNGYMRFRNFTALTGLEIPLRTTTGFS